MAPINLEQIYIILKELSKADACLYGLLFLCFTYLISRAFRKKKKFVKIKNSFYNTGFKFIYSAWDVVKLKIRLGDYCDKAGIRYCYLFQFKLFNFEMCKVKYIDGNGKIYRRNINYRS